MIAKKENEIQELTIAGNILSFVLRELLAALKPGVTTATLDTLAEKLIRQEGALPAFLNYKPTGAAYPYPAVLCISVNDEVVHGIPSEAHVLQEGDVVTVDLGLSYNGFFVDSARTAFVGKGESKGQKLLDGTLEALGAAIAATKVGGHIGDIGAAVEAVARKYSLGVVEDLGGHAVGRSVHEKPFISNVGVWGTGEKIVEGMVLALEPIFAEGKGDIVLLEDKWTYATKDGSRAAHFEQTIIVTKTGAEILTPF